MLSTFVPLINGTKLDVGIYYKSYGFHRSLRLIFLEYSLCSVLSPGVLALDASAIVSTNVIPDMGVDKLLYVRRTDVTFPLQTGRNACFTRSQ